jgi:oligoendopeptidase F
VLLKQLGLDVTDPTFWDGGLSVLEQMVDEAEQLAAD